METEPILDTTSIVSGTEFIVRAAKAEDMIDVIKLIRELAEFEDMPEGPKLTCKDLVRDGFELEPPLFHCFVAQLDEGPIIGYAIYFFTYSTWLGRAMMLEDLYVSRDHRRRGVGKGLFNSVAKDAVEHNCCRLEFHVLEWNPARRFYESRGAVDLTKEEKWLLYRISGKALNEAALEAC